MKSATDRQADGVAVPAVRPTDHAHDDAGDAPSTDVSWVARCQRQFDDSDRDLQNLVDGENAAFYDGV